MNSSHPPSSPAPVRATWTTARGTVRRFDAWTADEIRRAMDDLLASVEAALPVDRAARIVVKPNLNNDLLAVTGNSVDLRVLLALLRGLQDRGYTDLTVADGSNVGIDRRGIDSFRRLRVDRACARLGVRLVNLNADPGLPVSLHAGAAPRIGRVIQEKDFLISVPKIKTHAEAILSCAMKNWVGIVSGQDKRQVHYDLCRNIFALNEWIRPDLIVVDGIIGMEGNGPGDGDPFRIGTLLAGNDAFLVDLVVCRLMAIPWRRVPALVHAAEAGYVTDALAAEVERTVPVLRPIRLPPPRSRLAVLSEAPALGWLKRAVRPLVARPGVAEAAYRLRVIQDVYDVRDDDLRVTGRDGTRCGDCHRCEAFCPTGLTREEIGVRTDDAACLQCLYCWFTCPQDAIRVEGEARHLGRQAARYRKPVSSL